ncbi:hypothetical protein [Paenibacillus chitinolyticus]|uniref:hypothetical protein n=1 Tax=Paenibacillus chitinolyticus TaxID=79263 RepID=UPI00365A02E2
MIKFKKVAMVLGISSVTFASALSFQPQQASALNVPWGSIAWKIISYTSNTLYSVEPSYETGPYGYRIGLGSIGFNNKGNSGFGATAKVNARLQAAGEEFTARATSDWTNFTGKLAVSFIDLRDNSIPKSQTITSGQSAIYPVNHNNANFDILFSNTKSDNWALYVIGSSYYNSFGVLDDSKRDVFDGKGKRFESETINGNFHIIPSKSHIESNKIDKNAPLNMQQLNEQGYDREAQTFVDTLKDFDAGDVINFTDKVKKVTYDSSSDVTTFVFDDGKSGAIEWPFSGKYDKKYPVGSNINLTFKVVNFDGQYETIDYIKNSKENSKPESLGKYIKR